MNMNFRRESALRKICYPYVFALKEGKDYQKDMMDFSLILLQKNCTERLPANKRKRSK